MEAIITTIITTVGTIVITLISKNTNKKIDKVEQIKHDILEEVKKNRAEVKKEISDHIMDNNKTYLTDFLSDVEAGEPKSETQVRRAYEIKQDYNERGGDSYVDDKWDELIKKGILSKRKIS